MFKAKSGLPINHSRPSPAIHYTAILVHEYDVGCRGGASGALFLLTLFNPFRCLVCRRGLRGQAIVDPVAQPRRVRQAGHCDEGKNNSVNDYEDLCCSYFSPFLNQTSRHVKLLGTGSGYSILMRLWIKENYYGAQKRGVCGLNVSSCVWKSFKEVKVKTKNNSIKKSLSAFLDSTVIFSVEDPHHVNADLGLAFHFNADTDPAFHFNVDPDPDSLQGDASLSPLVYRLSRAPF
jgi:hypothetical protein